MVASVPGLVIAVDDPSAPDVEELVGAHLRFARYVTPIAYSHAMPVEALRGPDITLFSARRNGELLGIGALMRIDATHVEVKSMHTAAPARGAGVGGALLAHLIGVARAGGYRRISLETGTPDDFAPAHALYVRAGFVECPPFGAYTENPHSMCMTMPLDD
jgi:putative acetyltransferase